jgi:hypothetical protein
MRNSVKVLGLAVVLLMVTSCASTSEVASTRSEVKTTEAKVVVLKLKDGSPTLMTTYVEK